MFYKVCHRLEEHIYATTAFIKPQSILKKQRLVNAHFKDEEIEAQRGLASLPKSAQYVLIWIHIKSTFLQSLSRSVP